ncbi:helix-turn-helix domain-containing protein [Actinomadura sp. WMMB 499]|uniref:helix-turn-helix domain-containing protein n=1 Tax=Actinomadura sp. WMMB 499 TaxID=1219491 RepID=UPI00159D74B1|nr:helix-turn-helix transcriptional regulator [Actinomadura sp. WMMB 499]
MTFGEKLRALMVERKISQRRLAQLVPCDNGHLSKVANGLKNPSTELAERLDVVLDAGGRLAALRSRSPAHRAREDRLADDVAPELGGARLLAARGRPADGAFVDAVRETSQALVRMDMAHGASDILPLALRIFRAVNHKLGTGAYRPAIERDLLAAAGEAGEVAAWIAHDADEQDVSRRVIHEALMLSRQAGDRSLELFELTHLAMLAIHLRRPAEALRITGDLLDEDLPPRVRALLDIRRGRAFAQLGHDGRARDALGRARSILQDGITSRDAYWTWWLTDAEVLWHTGMAHAELGEWSAAVPLMSEAGELRMGYQRARFNDQVHLLNALVHVGDWSEAEPVLAEAADAVVDVNSVRTTNLLRRVTERIGRAGAPSTVAAQADDLHRFIADASPHASVVGMGSIERGDG